jgi:hypothetical protein
VVIAGVLGTAVAFSLLHSRREERAAAEGSTSGREPAGEPAEPPEPA